MLRHYPPNLRKFGISTWGSAEAMAWCRQYDEKRKKAASLMGPSSPNMSGMPRGNTVGRPTEAAVLNRDQLLREIEIIESSARETAGGIWYEALIDNVCRGIGYDYLAMILPTYHRGAFYNARREFLARVYFKCHNTTMEHMGK